MLELALNTAEAKRVSGIALGFFNALARQCFINEYVFALTDVEIREASALRDALVAALEADAEVPALWPIAVAAYFPLYTLPSAAGLLDRNWPEEVASLLVQQVREPAEEMRLRGTIPRLTKIEDDVSVEVQNQYEQNPYPRWINVARNDEPKTVRTALHDVFPLVQIPAVEELGNPDILIAGCGTGQHPIGVTQEFHGARVLAVDLSMASLSYAKRKTREMGLTSIEYAQADILELESLGRSFDIIESGGVLHHLADPWAGWRVLLSLLRPQGLMKLGFYSEVARRDIVRARGIIAEQGYGATPDDIREGRQYLMDIDNLGSLGKTTQTTDFFSMSACRDLLFHVQEHRMTLTGIEQFLREQDLAFLGFIVESSVLRAYKLRFPNDPAAIDLGQWQIFENENPDIFFGMYQFWIQKRS